MSALFLVAVGCGGSGGGGVTTPPPTGGTSFTFNLSNPSIDYTGITGALTLPKSSVSGGIHISAYGTISDETYPNGTAVTVFIYYPTFTGAYSCENPIPGYYTQAKIRLIQQGTVYREWESYSGQVLIEDIIEVAPMPNPRYRYKLKFESVRMKRVTPSVALGEVTLNGSGTFSEGSVTW